MKFAIPFALFLFFTSFHAFSQVKVTSYSIHALGTSYTINDNFSAELKLFANQWDIGDTGIEFSGSYNFKPGDYHQFSAGIGLGSNSINDGGNGYLCIPVALEIFPLQNFKRLSLVFELAPEFYFEDGTNLRHLWGIRYAFAKQE